MRDYTRGNANARAFLTEAVVRLILVRHGETDWNRHARLQGSTDLPLSQTGRAQGLAVSKRLSREKIDVLVSSPLLRAAETARMISDARPAGPSPRFEPVLAEIHLGAWEGLTLEELRQRFPRELDRWRTDPRAVPPGGEPRRSTAARIRSFIGRLAGNSAETVVIVGHLLVFQALICALMGISPRSRWPFHLYAASLSELRTEGSTTSIIQLNNLSHLDAAGLDVESIRDR